VYSDRLLANALIVLSSYLEQLTLPFLGQFESRRALCGTEGANC